MHDYTVTDRVTGEQTKLVAPNRNAALKAYIARRIQVTRVQPTQKLNPEPEASVARPDPNPATARSP